MRTRSLLTVSTLVLCSQLVTPSSALGFSSTVPSGSGIQVIGVHPEPRLDPRPLVSHFPLANFLSFELDFSTPAMALTFETATVSYYDEDGTLYAQKTFGVPDFDTYAIRIGSNPPGTGANIPMGERIVLPFPLEDLAHNEVPRSVDVAFCFTEFAGQGGTCVDPLVFEGIELFEYRVPPGQTYIYPTQTPALQNGLWWSGGAFELTKPNGHRLGGFRRNGLTAWVNQRYAWDIGVILGNGGPDCDDGNGGSGNSCNQLSHYFAWGEPILAPAGGEVVLLIQGNPDNPEPRCVGRQDCSACTSYSPTTPALCDFAPGAATCNNQPDAGLCSAMTNPCPPGGFPGSGNQVVLLHDNGEYTTFAHMMQSSNANLSCGQIVQRGDVIGAMGMSGSGSNPHLHFSALFTPGPEQQIAEGPPMYFNNAEFVTPGTTTPRRQLDTAIPTNTLLTSILAPPTPLAQNPPQLQGNVNEQEPNDTLAQHTALSIPTTVAASLEDTDVGDLAVRGDGIEDVFRLDLGGPDALRIDLGWQDGSQNLDVYALNADLRVLNETRAGTWWQPGTSEKLCLELGAGAYYLMVTNADQSPPGDTAYTLSVVSDPQTIAVTIADPGPIAVDGACEATVEFEVDLHDNCCLDPDDLKLQVVASNPTGNATLGPVVLDSPQVQSATDVTVSGRVEVSDLTSCPAVVRIEASAQDCSGNVVSTADAGTDDAVDVIDDTPPTVMSSVTNPLLWPPNHRLRAVGFARNATDNCDAHVADSLTTVVWGDEPEIPEAGDGVGQFAPDAKDLEGALRLRSERRGPEDGRVYLVTTRAADACGNAAFSCATAGVQHGQSAGSAAALAAQRAAALGFCEANDGAAPAGFTQHGVSAEIGEEAVGRSRDQVAQEYVAIGEPTHGAMALVLPSSRTRRLL